MPTHSVEQLIQAFRAFDTNGDGLISKGEFLKALTRTGPGCSPVDTDRARKMWEQFDADDNGSLSYEEFAQTWGGGSVKKSAVVAARPAVPQRSEEEWSRIIMEEDRAAFGTTEPGSDASAEASVNRGVTIGFLSPSSTTAGTTRRGRWSATSSGRPPRSRGAATLICPKSGRRALWDEQQRSAATGARRRRQTHNIARHW